MNSFFVDLNVAKDSLLSDESKSMYAGRLYGYLGVKKTWKESATYYGCVIKGQVELKSPGRPSITLNEGMYFSCPLEMEISGKGRAMVVERLGYVGLFQVGGPVENMGRLCYIDNCMSTVLVSPSRLGDPCLNLLTFPANQEQTMHIHPSLRWGMVIGGSGVCLDKNKKKTPLKVGTVFQLGIGFRHCFNAGEEGLTIIAFHPDSDVGPTDAVNPMLSRTYIKS